jgi:hypothetical protein
MPRIMLAAAALLALAACDQYRADGYGSSTYPGYAAPSYSRPAYGYGTYGETTRYGDPVVRDRQLEGCASGAPADVLHQNRPGGTDYNPARCGAVGY